MRHLRTVLGMFGLVACLSVAALAFARPAHAGGVHVSVGIGLPFPVVVAPAPVIAYPAPVIVHRPPVVVAPPPVVVHGGYYGHYHQPWRQHHHRPWRHHRRW